MSRRTALVVDDSRAWRDELAEVLQELDFEVATASDRRSASAVLARGPFDIAVIDVNLAGETHDRGGLAVNRHIQERSPSTQVILISAQTLTATETAAIAPAIFVEKADILRRLSALDLSAPEHRGGS